MTHEQLLNKLYYEDLHFIGVNPLYLLKSMMKKKELVKKKEYKPIYSEDYYAYQMDLTELSNYKIIYL